MSQKKPAPFLKIHYGRNYWRKYLKICHKAIQLINKQFPNFLYPNCNRFFSASYFPGPLKTEPVGYGGVIPRMQIRHFSIGYQMNHIQRQNSVKSNASNHILFNLVCFDLSFSHQGFILTSEPFKAQVNLCSQSRQWLLERMRLRVELEHCWEIATHWSE